MPPASPITPGVPLAEVGDPSMNLSGSAKDLGLDQAGVADTTEVLETGTCLRQWAS
jgi:hypothetical protein